MWYVAGENIELGSKPKTPKPQASKQDEATVQGQNDVLNKRAVEVIERVASKLTVR